VVSVSARVTIRANAAFRRSRGATSTFRFAPRREVVHTYHRHPRHFYKAGIRVPFKGDAVHCARARDIPMSLCIRREHGYIRCGVYIIRRSAARPLNSNGVRAVKSKPRTARNRAAEFYDLRVRAPGADGCTASRRADFAACNQNICQGKDSERIDMVRRIFHSAAADGYQVCVFGASDTHNDCPITARCSRACYQTAADRNAPIRSVG